MQPDKNCHFNPEGCLEAVRSYINPTLPAFGFVLNIHHDKSSRMVKRAKSPDIPDDAKYLVVHQPYPLNANFELPGDYIAFALWAASVLGSPTPILGIHHRPGAWSTVILEVERKVNVNMMLGEHRWSEVLKNPREEEEGRISQVFYCLYTTTRAAQKDGWKRIHVEPEWFIDKGWNLETGPFKHPYPETHWCPELREDVTNKKIARPLPVAVKPPPPSAPSLVPGSAQWVDAVQSGRPTVQEQAGAWTKRGGNRGRARGGPGVNVNRGRGGGVGANNAPTAGSSGRGKGVPINVWNRARGGASGSSAAGPSNLAAGKANPWSRIETAPKPGEYFPPPGLTRVEQSLSSMNLSDDEDGTFVPFEPNSDSDDDLDIPYGSTVASGESPPALEQNGMEEPVNLWAQLETKKDGEGEEEPMCSIHGLLCKKGICAERQRLEREKRKAKEAEERAEAKKKREEEKKNNRKKPQGEEGGFRTRTRAQRNQAT